MFFGQTRLKKDECFVDEASEAVVKTSHDRVNYIVNGLTTDVCNLDPLNPNSWVEYRITQDRHVYFPHGKMEPQY